MLKTIRGFLRDRLDDKGHEKLSPVPKEPIIEEFSRPPTLEERISRLMRYEREKMERFKDMSGYETPEEADDFDIEDDPVDPSTPYEEYFYPVNAPTESITESEEFKRPEPSVAGQDAPPAGTESTYEDIQKQIADLQSRLNNAPETAQGTITT